MALVDALLTQNRMFSLCNGHLHSTQPHGLYSELYKGFPQFLSASTDVKDTSLSANYNMKIQWF